LYKKKKTFAGGNIRFLCVKGFEEIFYSNDFPKPDVLPFFKPEDLPKIK